MSILVTYETALRFWDLLRRPPRRDRKSRRMPRLAFGKPTPGDVEEFRDDCRRFFGARSEDILSGPITLSVGSADDRAYFRGVECHVWSGPVPTGAMLQVSSNVFVATPEQCYLERTRMRHDSALAASLDLVRTGFRLCGVYSLAPSDAGEDGIAERLPLTSVATLRRYLAQADVCRAPRALSLLPCVLEGSASPRESAMAMQLWLPRRLGGFGLGRPELNYPVDIDGDLLVRGGARSYRIDLCYPDARLAVEYDGGGHANPARIASDAQRRNDLAHMGWKVITVTARQLGSREAVWKIADDIASTRGMRLRVRSGSFPRRWGEFRRIMLSREEG